MTRSEICTRALNCPHTITQEAVVLRFDPNQPGSNALAQLLDRLSASAQQAEPVAKRLIGWRTSDYLMETSDREKAKNWEAHYEMLPIFEGDPDTKLAATAPSAFPAVLTDEEIQEREEDRYWKANEPPRTLLVADPQPSAKALTDEQIREIARNSAQFVSPGVYDITRFECEDDVLTFARDILAAEQPSEKLTDAQIADQPARYSIDGAIAFGRMGQKEPPTGHWLTEYWYIGRLLANLGETSAWDNQTPVDSQSSEDKREVQS